MIPSALIEEVRRRLAEGRLSQRSIAQALGVSRGTVNAVAQGKRRDIPTRQREHQADIGFTPPAGMPVRCPGCGGLTQMPCLLCYLRTTTDARKNVRPRHCRRPNRETTEASHCG